MNDPEKTNRFTDLLWPHAKLVLRVAHTLTHSHADAEDLSQEAMLKAFRAIDSLRNVAGAKTWLLTILRNCHIDRIRAGKLEVKCETLEVDPESPPDFQQEHVISDVDQVLESFSDEQVIRALRRLPHDICWTLLLVDVEGLDDAEAAVILSIPTGTVKSRLHRGRKMLLAMLKPSEVTLGVTRASSALESLAFSKA